MERVLKHICIAIVAVVFLSGFATYGRPARKVREHLSANSDRRIEYPDSLRLTYLYIDGIEALDIAGDTLLAERLWRQAVAEDSTYAPALYRLAQLTAARGDTKGAAALAARVYRADSADRWYAQLYARALLSEGSYAEALPLYRRLTAIDPHDPDNYRILALLYARMQLPFSAIATLDTAQMRFGRHRELSDMKQQLLFTTGQFEKAVTEGRRMVESFPYDVESYISLSEAYSATGRDSLAHAALNDALKIDSTDLNVWQALGHFYEQRRRYRDYLAVERRLFADDRIPLSKKIERFDRLTSNVDFYREHYFRINDLASTLAVRYPQSRDVVALYGRHLTATGNIDHALEYYKRHLDDENPDLDLYMAVIQIESYLQHTDSMSHYLDRACGSSPTMRRCLPTWTSERHRGAIRRGCRQLPRGTSLRRQRYAARRAVGLYRRRIPHEGRHAPHVACLRPFAVVLSDNASVMNNYAYFLTLENRSLDRALDMAERVMKIEGSNPTFIDTYAWVLYKIGRLDEAKRAMQQALSLDTRRSADLAAHYGDILWDLGETFMAETYWQRAVERGFDAERMKTHVEQMKQRFSDEDKR